MPLGRMPGGEMGIWKETPHDKQRQDASQACLGLLWFYCYFPAFTPFLYRQPPSCSCLDWAGPPNQRSGRLALASLISTPPTPAASWV